MTVNGLQTSLNTAKLFKHMRNTRCPPRTDTQTQTRTQTQTPTHAQTHRHTHKHIYGSKQTTDQQTQIDPQTNSSTDQKTYDSNKGKATHAAREVPDQERHRLLSQDDCLHKTKTAAKYEMFTHKQSVSERLFRPARTRECNFRESWA
jgi:hypothetical protein